MPREPVRTRRTSRTRRRDPVVAGRKAASEPSPGGFPLPLLSWSSLQITVQVLPQHLAAGQHLPVEHGEELDVAPAIYLEACAPVFVGADRWRTDEYGCVAARGTVLSPRPPERPCDQQDPHLLQVAGYAFPLNWAAAGVEFEHADRLDVSGALYLDPELAPDAPFGEAVALARRHWKVRAIRRYRRTARVPASPVALPRLPDPDDVSEKAVYVVDLGPRPGDASDTFGL